MTTCPPPLLEFEFEVVGIDAVGGFEGRVPTGVHSADTVAAVDEAKKKPGTASASAVLSQRSRSPRVVMVFGETKDGAAVSCQMPSRTELLDGLPIGSHHRIRVNKGDPFVIAAEEDAALVMQGVVYDNTAKTGLLLSLGGLLVRIMWPETLPLTHGERVRLTVFVPATAAATTPAAEYPV
jgi:hypothetical protein